MAHSGYDERAFYDVVKRIDQVRWENMDVEKLKKMHEALEERQSDLCAEVQSIRRVLEDDINKNDVMEFESHRHRARSLEREYKRIENTKTKIYNTRQRIIVREKMKDLIGEHRRSALEFIVLVLILFVLGILIFEYYKGEDLSPEILWKLFYLDAAACTVFLGEFFLRLYLAEDRAWFWRHNWIDFVSSLPIPPEPLLQAIDANTWGRTLRLVRILRALRAFRILSFMWRGMERLQATMDVQLMKKSIIWVGAIIVVGSGLVYHLERENLAHAIINAPAPFPADGVDTPTLALAFGRDNGILAAALARSAGCHDGTGIAAPGQTASPDDCAVSGLPQAAGVREDRTNGTYYMENFSRSLWWGFNTVSTGGFGDLYRPKKPLAILVTAILIISGLVVMGVFIATLASAYKGEMNQELEIGQDDLRDELGKILAAHEKLYHEVRSIGDAISRSGGSTTE